MINTLILQAAGQQGIIQIAIFAAMFIGFYFLMIRPQMQKQKKEKAFQDGLKVGTRIVTTSGLHGRIAQIQEDGIIIETLSGKLKFEKAAISREFTQNRFPATTAAAK